jgi:hypothetical protein
MYEYQEVPTELDPSKDLDWLFEKHGRCIARKKQKLSVRDDILPYDPAKHAAIMKKGIQWKDYPEEHRPIIERIIQENWDPFNPDTVQTPIRGYEFVIHTGTHPPVCCKPPRYGPHEARVIDELVTELERKDIVEDNRGPYGALVVLASKPDQGHVHWTKYVFRLCVSYRQLNMVTRGFKFPVTRCNDAVNDIGPRSFLTTGDLKTGYWQV